MSSTSIPLGDAWLLRHLTTRTRLVRLTLGAAILAIMIAAVLVAGPPSSQIGPLLPAGSDGIVVLDVSASASAVEYSRIHAYLTEIVRSKGRFGLVLFSDSAYEALPPNTPAKEFGTIARYFQGPVFPTNPWAIGFSLGTSISQGLNLASSIIIDNGIRRRDVWLISDLDDSGTDRPLLNTALRSYTVSGIDLHVLGVDPARADLAPYRRLFGQQGPSVTVKPLPVVPTKSRAYPFPTSLAIVAGILMVILTLNELMSSPLRWGSGWAPELELSA